LTVAALLFALPIYRKHKSKA